MLPTTSTQASAAWGPGALFATRKPEFRKLLSKPSLDYRGFDLGLGSSLIGFFLFFPCVTSKKSFTFSDPSGPHLYRGDGIPAGMGSSQRGFLLPSHFFPFLFLSIGRKSFALFSSLLRLSQFRGVAAPAAKRALAWLCGSPFLLAKKAGALGSNSEWPFL